MVSPAQARLNAETATRVLGRQLGFADADGRVIYRNLSAAQQIALTNALAAYVRANPQLFDTGAPDLTNPVRSAAEATNTLPSAAGYSFGAFVDAAVSNARAINPLDPSNAGTVGRNLLIGAVVLGGLWIFLNSATARRILSK